MEIREVDLGDPDDRRTVDGLRVLYDIEMQHRYPDSGISYGPDTLPSGMTPPRGTFFVAFDGDHAIGCAGLRRLPLHIAQFLVLPIETWDACAEGKSLFVREEWRGKGHGKAIALERARRAADLGYDTLYCNTGANQPESIRTTLGVLDGAFVEEIDIYDPSNPLVAHAFRIDIKNAFKVRR